MRRILTGLVLILMLTGCDAAGPFEEGLAAYERGDYATALRLWRPLAEQGEAACAPSRFRSFVPSLRCPLYPQKRTFSKATSMSLKCQYQTHNL
jgi:hypothetical protein